MKWPTYEEAESLANQARDGGFLINMQKVEEFWTWVWLHSASGMTFPGACDCGEKAVALVCALQSVPIVPKA